MHRSECPAEETLALFVDGHLGPEPHKRVVDHLAECAECRDIVNTTFEFANAEGGTKRGRRQWVVPAAIVAVAAVLALALFLGPMADRFAAPGRLDDLAAATTSLESRSFAARPSIDMPWKPHEVFRGGREAPLGNPALHEAAARIEAATETRRTATNLHHLGLAHLLLNDRDAAIRYLEEALEAETGQKDVTAAVGASANAALLNDLAAACDARRDARRGDETRAALAIGRAWQLQRSPAIAWTRATILGSRQAWNDYLALDGSSEWAAEAREHLAQSGN